MKLRDCEGCLVYGTDNKPLSRARVESDPDETIRLYFSNYKLKSVRFQTSVEFYDIQQGLIRCRCELVLRKNTGETRNTEPWMSDCKVLEVEEIFQRQHDLRVRVQIATEFLIMSNGQFFVGTIKNVSAGGLFVVTSQGIKVGDHLAFSYRFGSDVLCKLVVKVLRVKQGGTGGFGYGCKFMNLTPETEAIVRKFVFEKQMEIKTKNRKPEGFD